MQQSATYHHDHLYFDFSFVNAQSELALGLKVKDENGEPIMEQDCPLAGGAVGASWLLYWQLLKAAKKEVIHSHLKKEYSCNLG